MVTLVEYINRFSNTVFGWLFAPLRWMDPIWALLVISVASGLLMLAAYKKFSNQEAIRRYKEKIRGNLLGVRLYQHDVALVLRLQGAILRDTFRYIGHSFAPVLVLLVPITLIIVQLNYYFDRLPLQPERSTLLEARFDPEQISVTEEPIRLEGEGLVVETPPVRVRQLGEVTWRVRFEREGPVTVQLRAGERSFEKRVDVGHGWGPVSPLRTSSALDLLLYPGEPPIESSPLRAIEIRHEPLPLTVWGWSVHWLIFFFLISILSAFLLKGVFGVEL